MKDEWKILKGFIERRLDDIEEETEVVGYISSDLQAKFKKLEKEKERFVEDVSLKKSQLELELQRKMQEEFDDRKEELEIKHEALWNEVYEICFLDPKKRYFQRKDQVFGYIEN